MRALIIATLIASITPAAALAQAAAPAPAAAAKAYTTSETTIGTLMEDPAAKAVVDKHLPGFLANPQIEQGKGMTLKAVQQYVDTMTDKVLADIDADLAKLPKK